MNINGIEILDITDGVFKYYIEETPNNKDLDKDKVRIELTRDVLAGTYKGDRDRDGRFLYHYGNLAIIVKDNKIVWIKNYKGHFKTGTINWQVKYQLDIKLNLTRDTKLWENRTGIILNGYASRASIIR